MSAVLERRTAETAAAWYVQLHSSAVTERDRAACTRWRARDPRHEDAWQRVLVIVGALRGVPAGLAQPALGREQRFDRRTAVKALALLAAVPVAYAGWRVQGYGADLRTATGEQRVQRLVDGSRLQLNTATTVDLDFNAERRLLRLHRGEMFLQSDVTTSQPLIVATEHGEIHSKGATLLVRCDGGQTRLVVEQGRCEGTVKGANSVAVEAGFGVHLDADGVSLPALADAHAGDWTRGVLHADNMRLADFAAELGRYRPGLLRCDPAVADLRISGAFQLRDTGSALDSLTGVLPVAIVSRSRWWTTIVPRDSAPV